MDEGQSTQPRAVPGYPALDPARRRRAAELLLALVEARLPGELTEAQRHAVAAVVGAQLAQTERLHAFELSNSDEPAFAMPAARGVRR